MLSSAQKTGDSPLFLQQMYQNAGAQPGAGAGAGAGQEQSPFYNDQQQSQQNTQCHGDRSCSMIRKFSSKRSEFLRFNLYFCHVYRWIFLFSFRNTKISEFYDMTKSWAARLCRLPKQVIGSAA